MNREFEDAGICYQCNAPCYLECGKCFCLLRYLGEKHACFDPDEGFFEQETSNLPLCDACEKKYLRANENFVVS